jgi:hypothetical protein
MTSLRRHSDVVDITNYVNELREQLLVSADAGGEQARLLAERLVAPLQSATRLVLLEALSAAAGEITSDLAPGSVEVRLRGGDPEFVVMLSAVDTPDDAETSRADIPASGSGGAVGDGDDGGTSRVTLRLPEQLKLRIEDAAGQEGLSVNSWLVRTLTEVMEPTARAVRPAPRSSMRGERFTGWTRS